MTSLPIIENVTLSFANISHDIYPLIHSIRPDWMSSNTRLVTFTEGLTNIILGLFDNRTPDDDSKTLIIKIYGSQTELFIDRQSEINAMNLFSRENVFSQRVLIQFNNGIIYEYASGRTCSRDDVQNENISRLIAIKLAQFHNVPIEKPGKPYIISLSRKFLELLHEKHILPRLIPNAEFGKDLVLCHNDLLVKNIIYNEKDQTVTFIDFEYTHVNYALSDIADHFIEYTDVDNIDYSYYPSRDQQKRWLTIYFQTRGTNQPIINDDLCHLIDQFSALSHLMWGLWGLVQSQISHLDFDYIAYSKSRLDCYQNLRSLLFEQ